MLESSPLTALCNPRGNVPLRIHHDNPHAFGASPFSKGEFLATVDCACSSRFEGTLVTPNDGATRSDREGGTQGLQ